MSHISNVVKFLSLCVCLGAFSAMDWRSAATSTVPTDIKYNSLKEGQIQLDATVMDEPNLKFEVSEFSFGDGVTTLEVNTEVGDVQSMPIDFSQVREIEVLEESFASEKFTTGAGNIPKKFVRTKVIKNDGAVVENVLFPEFMQINGTDKSDKINKTWFLSKINKIIISKSEDVEKAVTDVDKAFQESKEKAVNK
jgi:hypothetical protein